MGHRKEEGEREGWGREGLLCNLDVVQEALTTAVVDRNHTLESCTACRYTIYGWL